MRECHYGFLTFLFLLVVVVGCADKTAIPAASPPPVADFEANSVQGFAPLTVSFNDQSTGKVIYWQWNFGNGHFSIEKAPSNTYTNPGTYTVSLAVMGPGGSDVETKVDYIQVKSNVVKWEEAGSYIGQVKTVEGIVVGTYYAKRVKGKPTFLNFHESQQGYFKCVIWNSNRDEFLKAFHPNPETHLLNKRVRVKGLINEYPKGSGVPEMILKEPSQVKVIGE